MTGDQVSEFYAQAAPEEAAEQAASDNWAALERARAAARAGYDGTATARRTGKTLRLMEQFNKVCPIGSPVLYWPGKRSGEGRKSVTRSKAWLLGGHTPVVMVEGYAGGIALSHIMGYSPVGAEE